METLRSRDREGSMSTRKQNLYWRHASSLWIQQSTDQDLLSENQEPVKEYSSDKHFTSCIPPDLAQGSQFLAVAKAYTANRGKAVL